MSAHEWMEPDFKVEYDADNVPWSQVVMTKTVGGMTVETKLTYKQLECLSEAFQVLEQAYRDYDDYKRASSSRIDIPESELRLARQRAFDRGAYDD